MEKIIMSEGASKEFDTYLHKSYEYLNECDKAIDNCELLDLLKIRNNNSLLKEEVVKQKEEVNKISRKAHVFEEEILNLDYLNRNKIESFAELIEQSGDNQNKISLTPINIGEFMRDILGLHDNLK